MLNGIRKGNYLATAKKSLYVFVFQGLAFAISTLSHFLIINHFDKHSYAILTIFLATIGTSNILSDSGITSAYRRLAGIHWENKERFSTLVQSLFSLRREILAIIAPITLCLAAYLFIKESNGWYNEVVIPLILLAIFAVLEVQRGMQVEILRSQMKIKAVQLAENLQNVLRLILVLLVVFTTNKNLLLLLLIYVMSGFMSLLYLKTKAKSLIEPNSTKKKSYIKIMRSRYLQLLPNSIFYVVQSQITLFILAIFNQPNAIADFGALSKIGIVFNLLNAVVLNIFSVNFSRTTQIALLRKKFFLFLTLVMGLSLGMVTTVYFSKWWIIKLFGPQYADLAHLLPLFMVYSSITFIFGSIYTMNTAKSWIGFNSKYAIPVSIICIVAGVVLLDLKRLDQVIIFSMLPILFTGFLKIADTLKGLKLIKT